MPTTRSTRTNAATGPKTPAGKAISARNATSHGLFCRQTVLPHLGEDPAGYQKLLDTLREQLRPRNLIETQYLELWADASWKMRRLSRLEAQVWEDDTTDQDARLVKLERLYRLQGGLRRQLDRALRMLSRDVPGLFAQRTREDVVAGLGLTESQCAQEPFRARDVERSVQANRHWPAPAEGFTDGLDNTPSAPHPPAQDTPPETSENKICQNELCQAGPVPADTPSPCQAEVAGPGEPEGASSPPRNEAGLPVPGHEEALPEDDDPAPEDESPEDQAHSSRQAQRRRLQELEDLLNSGTLTQEQRTSLLRSEDIPGYTIGGGRIEIHKRGPAPRKCRNGPTSAAPAESSPWQEEEASHEPEGVPPKKETRPGGAVRIP